MQKGSQNTHTRGDAEQSVAVIAAVIVEELIAEGRYHDAMAVADILIEHYPRHAISCQQYLITPAAKAAVLIDSFPHA